MTVIAKSQNGTSPAFILRPAQGPGLRSDNENTRACMGCKGENRPTKGGYFSAGFFFCGRHERRKGAR